MSWKICLQEFSSLASMSYTPCKCCLLLWFFKIGRPCSKPNNYVPFSTDDVHAPSLPESLWLLCQKDYLFISLDPHSHIEYWEDRIIIIIMSFSQCYLLEYWHIDWMDSKNVVARLCCNEIEGADEALSLPSRTTSIVMQGVNILCSYQ